MIKPWGQTLIHLLKSWLYLGKNTIIIQLQVVTDVSGTITPNAYFLKSQLMGRICSLLKSFHLLLFIMYVPQNITKILFFWNRIFTAQILSLWVCVLKAQDVLNTKSKHTTMNKECKYLVAMSAHRPKVGFTYWGMQVQTYGLYIVPTRINL